MVLTGKAKEDFGLWHFENYNNAFEYTNFHELSDNLKNAIIIEWLDDVNIYITVQAFDDISSGYCRGFEGVIYDEKNNKNYFVLNDGDVFQTRQETTVKVIQKANKIYNEKFKQCVVCIG